MRYSVIDELVQILVKPNPVLVKPVKTLLFIVCLLIGYTPSYSQEQYKSASIAVFTGAMNYQGDLNPSSFKFSHSGLTIGLIYRKPLNRWFTLRGGITVGKIMAADKWNRDYLQMRNLSFTTTLQEIHTGLEVNVLDISTNRFTPYLYGGVAVFHFNPWTNDNSGIKTYLKPLSTEGQGISAYPERKPYQLTQFSLSFGAGLKFAISDAIQIGIELNQRKTFTDYLDDVSSSFVDVDILRQERGDKAVELAYRADEIPNGQLLYPNHGDQRGTPSEMDWYYFFGFTSEIKLHAIGGLFGSRTNTKGVKSQRCPRNVSY